MWEVLGIAPTADTAAVRRAYVAKLRAIDVEHAPAAFIRLREAYERALAADANGETDGDTEIAEDVEAIQEEDALAEEMLDLAPARTVTLAKAQPLPPAPPLPVEIGIEDDPEETIDDTLAREGVASAWRTFEHFMATGAIRLGEHAALVQKLMAAALDDTRPGSAALFHSILAKADGAKSIHNDDLADLRTCIADRLAAEKWLDALESNAGRRALGKRRFVVRASRILLGRKRRYRRSHPMLLAIQQLLGEYRTHRFWLEKRLGAERMAALEKRVQRDFAIRNRRAVILIIAVLSFLALDLIWVLFFAQ
jgi:hypothetical protein